MRQGIPFRPAVKLLAERKPEPQGVCAGQHHNQDRIYFPHVLSSENRDSRRSEPPSEHGRRSICQNIPGTTPETIFHSIMCVSSASPASGMGNRYLLHPEMRVCLPAETKKFQTGPGNDGRIYLVLQQPPFTAALSHDAFGNAPLCIRLTLFCLFVYVYYFGGSSWAWISSRIF